MILVIGSIFLVVAVIRGMRRKGRYSLAVVEGLVKHLLGNLTAWVEIGLDSTVEQDSFLWNDGQTLAKAMSRDLGDINPVIQNLPRDDMCEAQQGEDQLKASWLVSLKTS